MYDSSPSNSGVVTSSPSEGEQGGKINKNVEFLVKDISLHIFTNIVYIPKNREAKSCPF